MEKSLNNIGAIQLIVFYPDIKLESIENVHIIRIKSSRYNLLVMKDHSPIVGEVDNGTVDIEADNSLKYRNLKGFYSFSHNQFCLIITSSDYVREA